MADSYKKEKQAHKKLLEMLSRHFSEDEDEILDDEMEDIEEMEEMNPTPRSKKLKRRTPMLDMDDEEIDFDEDEDEEDEDEPKSLDKEKRKDLAVMVIAKKAGKKK